MGQPEPAKEGTHSKHKKPICWCPPLTAGATAGAHNGATIHFLKYSYLNLKNIGSGEDVSVNAVVIQRNWGAILADLRSKM